MKAVISIEHPAWAHQFAGILHTMQRRGDKTLILAIDKDRAPELLDAYGFTYKLMAHSSGRNILEKGWLFLKLCVTYTRETLRFKPDVLIGRASPMMAVAAFIARKPHILYEDTEVSKFSLFICKLFSAKIYTPKSFLTDLRVKQTRVDSFKELFYLHPNQFKPNPTLLKTFGFDPEQGYIIVRFVSWNASHDIGRKGLPEKAKLGFIQRLSRLGKVYVSSESTLSEELLPYALNLPSEHIHHALAFALLCISEGATVATEAAALGVHAIYINDIVSGTTKEFAERYGLMYNYQNMPDKYEHALEKACELLSYGNLREEGMEKRANMLHEKEDISARYLEEISRFYAEIGASE